MRLFGLNLLTDKQMQKVRGECYDAGAKYGFGEDEHIYEVQFKNWTFVTKETIVAHEVRFGGFAEKDPTTLIFLDKHYNPVGVYNNVTCFREIKDEKED